MKLFNNIAAWALSPLTLTTLRGHKRRMKTVQEKIKRRREK
ncbi:MAG: hypothetical protein ACLTK0_05855 [Anaerovoracaceae bacterium]